MRRGVCLLDHRIREERRQVAGPCGPIYLLPVQCFQCHHCPTYYTVQIAHARYRKAVDNLENTTDCSTRLTRKLCRLLFQFTFTDAASAETNKERSGYRVFGIQVVRTSQLLQFVAGPVVVLVVGEDEQRIRGDVRCVAALLLVLLLLVVVFRHSIDRRSRAEFAVLLLPAPSFSCSWFRCCLSCSLLQFFLSLLLVLDNCIEF